MGKKRAGQRVEIRHTGVAGTGQFIGQRVEIPRRLKKEKRRIGLGDPWNE